MKYAPNLTPADVHAATGVKLRALWRQLNRGQIPGAVRTPGGRWLIPADSLRAFVGDPRRLGAVDSECVRYRRIGPWSILVVRYRPGADPAGQ
jgi:glycine/D-amino acid oxidase-like deaminating enzyme